jgi:RNA polymerase sigma-70 factor (ECF subfamily)
MPGRSGRGGACPKLGLARVAVLWRELSCLVRDRPPALSYLPRKKWSRGRANGVMTLAYAQTTLERAAEHPGPGADPESQAWIAALRAEGPVRTDAVASLHRLLLRAARFEIGRRQDALAGVRNEDLTDLAQQAADDALMAVLRKLDDYRGASRFTTWAYKFALLEAGVKLRRRAWHGREVVLEPELWPTFRDPSASAAEAAEGAELLRELQRAVREALTPHQREVFAALALNGVPIDVLSERTGSSRGALYKTLHDARSRLRVELAAAGYGEGGAP